MIIPSIYRVLKFQYSNYSVKKSSKIVYSFPYNKISTSKIDNKYIFAKII